MTQPFTYFHKDGRSEIRVQPKGPLPHSGEAWVRGRYTPPDYPSPLEVRVGEAGVKAWMVIEWLRLCNNDVEEVIRGYGGVVTREDIEAAKWFYEQNEVEIDRRVSEELEPA